MESNQRLFLIQFAYGTSIKARVFDFRRDFASILIKRYTLCDLDLWISDENLFQTKFYFEIYWEFHQILAC